MQAGATVTGAPIVTPGGSSDTIGALSPADLVSKYEGQGKILRLLHLKAVPVGVGLGAVQPWLRVPMG